MSGPRWLTPEERELWLVLKLLTDRLQTGVDAQLRRDHGLTQFEYYTLVRLSGSPDRTASMSDLAEMVNGSLSRLSHVVGRLETRGWVVRRPSEQDGAPRCSRSPTPGTTSWPRPPVARRGGAAPAVRPLRTESVPRLVELLRPVFDPARLALSRRGEERPLTGPGGSLASRLLRPTNWWLSARLSGARR